MSGGAFNYVYLKDGSEILNNLEDLRGLEQHCRGLGLHNEADEIYNYLLFCETIGRRMNQYSNRISPLLKAIEWEASGDWGDGHIKQAYKEMIQGKSDG